MMQQLRLVVKKSTKKTGKKSGKNDFVKSKKKNVNVALNVLRVNKIELCQTDISYYNLYGIHQISLSSLMERFGIIFQ